MNKILLIVLLNKLNIAFEQCRKYYIDFHFLLQESCYARSTFPSMAAGECHPSYPAF